MLYLADQGDPIRSSIEKVIHNRFLKVHQAQITYYAPIILCLYTDKKIMSSIGITPAAKQTLFVEKYFDQPLETIIATHTDTPIQRSEIIELGNFSSRQQHSGRQLIYMTAAWINLYKKNFKHTIYQQYYRGIKIEHGQVKFHEKNGLLKSYSGAYSNQIH